MGTGRVSQRGQASSFAMTADDLVGAAPPIWLRRATGAQVRHVSDRRFDLLSRKLAQPVRCSASRRGSMLVLTPYFTA